MVTRSDCFVGLSVGQVSSTDYALGSGFSGMFSQAQKVTSQECYSVQISVGFNCRGCCGNSYSVMVVRNDLVVLTSRRCTFPLVWSRMSKLALCRQACSLIWQTRCSRPQLWLWMFRDAAVFSMAFSCVDTFERPVNAALREKV